MWNLMCLCFLTSVSARFYCGLDPFTNNAMELFIKVDCMPLLNQHNECCLHHGFCYLRKKERPENCDNNYCNCIVNISKEGPCKFHADNFCNTVKMNGPQIYPSFTMENGKR